MMTNRKEYMRKYMRDYWKTHPEQYAKQKKLAVKNAGKWNLDNPEQHKKYAREYRKRIKDEIYKLLGNGCANPFNLNHGDFLNDSRCLQIDHVNGNGRKERALFKGATDPYYKHILEQIKLGSKDYQLLCANCNWIKRIAMTI